MKKLISLSISLALLALIYHQIDFGRIITVFLHSSPFLLTISLSMVIPLTMATSWRLCRLMPDGTSLGFAEANRLTLMAAVLNMILPSKMGDVAKSAFMARRGHLSASKSLSLVVFEKACDMASLLAWCALGLLCYPGKNPLFWTLTAAVAGGFLFITLLIGSRFFASFIFDLGGRLAPTIISTKISKLAHSWNEMHTYFWECRSKLFWMACISLGIWFLHLVQIWLFASALGAHLPFATSIALAPLALFAGLLPLTFAGIGTRDAALIFFFAPYMASPDAAALGILCTMRYLLPALGGLPFMGTALK